MWQHFCISNAKAAAKSKTAPTLLAAFSSQQHRGCSKAAPTILAASL
jgi:hypothetical protein